MEFSKSFDALLYSISSLASDLCQWSGTVDHDVENKAKMWRKAQCLYLEVPGMVNIMLNYKICVEHDLPLHPTVYYELKEARKYKIDHGLGEIDMANSLYHESIELAKKSLMPSIEFLGELERFKKRLPHELLSFVYTTIKDTYTWRASNPELLERLAAMIRSYKPKVLVAAAHGSIMSALLLADLLEIPLYFIRFSMFKRHDEEPIITLSDEAWLYEYKHARVVLYDEDVAGGNTLGKFAEILGKLLEDFRTACSIRHGGATFKPDFTAKVWWD
jgi:adenine/guanine phosphoribosyltransferase-like PRPP-binding protein